MILDFTYKICYYYSKRKDHVIFENPRKTYFMRALIGIGIGVLILYLLALWLGMMIPFTWFVVTMSLVVTSFIYFPYILPKLLRKVKADEGEIWANPWLRESAVATRSFSGYRSIHAQVERQAGYHFMFPGEYLVKTIEMPRIMVLEGNPQEPFTLKGGRTLRFKYIVPFVVMPGRLIAFNRHSEEHIKRKVKTRCDGYLQGYIGDRRSLGFGSAAMEELKDGFEYLYGEDDEIDDDEWNMGIQIGTPTLYDVDNPDDVAKAKNLVTIMNTMMDIASDMVARSGNQLKFNEALKMALVSSGSADIEFLEVAGNLFGMPTDRKKGGK